jgi:hypothetical protein
MLTKLGEDVGRQAQPLQQRTVGNGVKNNMVVWAEEP